MIIFMFIIYTGSVFPLFSSGDSLQVPNNDFEALAADGFPVHWTVPGGTMIDGIQVGADSHVFHSGKQALAVSHDRWGQSVVESEPLQLRVGHLYRLSGWIKTESAVTDPIDRYPPSYPNPISLRNVCLCFVGHFDRKDE